MHQAPALDLEERGVDLLERRRLDERERLGADGHLVEAELARGGARQLEQLAGDLVAPEPAAGRIVGGDVLPVQTAGAVEDLEGLYRHVADRVAVLEVGHATAQEREADLAAVVELVDPVDVDLEHAERRAETLERIVLEVAVADLRPGRELEDLDRPVDGHREPPVAVEPLGRDGRAVDADLDAGPLLDQARDLPG